MNFGCSQNIVLSTLYVHIQKLPQKPHGAVILLRIRVLVMKPSHFMEKTIVFLFKICRKGLERQHSRIIEVFIHLN